MNANSKLLGKLKSIKDDKQYGAAWKRRYDLVKKENTLTPKESAELDLLSGLVQEYENKRFPLDKVHPAEALKFRLDILKKIREK